MTKEECELFFKGCKKIELRGHFVKDDDQEIILDNDFIEQMYQAFKARMLAEIRAAEDDEI